MSRPHRKAFIYGSLSTLALVFLRIALPWPLRGVMEEAFPGMTARGDWIPWLDSLPGNPVLILCASYFALSVGVGLFERSQRVWMARVASRTAHDLRAAAARGIPPGDWDDPAGRADFITRIIGDSARLKADFKGILIHLPQNGLLLIGITTMFLFLAPVLGLLFLLSGLLAVYIGSRAVEEVARTTRKQRKKESRYAGLLDSLQATPGDDEESIGKDNAETINRASSKQDVRTTWLMGRSTLHIYAAVAALISLALWLGIQDVKAGKLAPGVLFLFIAYSISIQRRAVRVGRQITRAGKLLANTDRIRRLIDNKPAKPIVTPVLSSTLRLEYAAVTAAGTARRSIRLGPLDLSLPREGRLLVLGGEGAGKSSLLQILAGRLELSSGRYLWDDRNLAHKPWATQAAVGYLAQEPAIRATSARQFLGIEQGCEPRGRTLETLETLGAWRVVCRLTKGLDQNLDSKLLSWSEKNALGLAAVVLSDQPVWVLDKPVNSLRGRDRRRLEHILQCTEGRTLIVSLDLPMLTDRFTHVLVLKKGRVIFSGTPAEWKETHG